MIEKTSAPSGFWSRRIKLRYVMLIIGVSILSLSFGQYALNSSNKTLNPTVIIQQSDDCPPPPVVRYRMNNYQFTHPLLLSDRMEESKDMRGLKNEIALIINQRKDAGQITSASVYVRSMNDNEWISINSNESYNPGSLIKVPIMMTYLHQSEKNSGLLDKKLTLDPAVKVPSQTFTGDRIVAGKPYTIKELLYYMIVKSDNCATFLLNNNVDIPEFKKLFTNIGIAEPDVHNQNFKISAADYSKFFRMLYNATYINNENAEFALTLLTQGDFAEGMLKLLPAEIKVAHKFGEWGNPNNRNDHQLHETGIIFYKDTPTLITVMTKGADVNVLPQVIREISKKVFDKLTEEQHKS